jgi:DNA polymerase-3 subunit delta
MPKIEPKVIQQELDQGLIRPFYWIYGGEALKVREILKRIRNSVLGEVSFAWSEEIFDGAESDGFSVCDAANSLSLGSDVKFVVVRDAHLLKEVEALESLFGPPQQRSQLLGVCVCVSKDLDARKKFSKLLLDRAAVVVCEEVGEAQRESWIVYLAQRQGVTVDPHQVMKWVTLDPWSLDLIMQELEKWSLSNIASDPLLEGRGNGWASDRWMDSFFSRNLEAALSQVGYFADHPEDALPLLGLLGWNVKQLSGFLADELNGTQIMKLNPYQRARFQEWAPLWKLDEVLELQRELFLLDLSFKQTPLLPLGLWSSLVQKFCRGLE